MDAINLAILKELKENSRITASQLSKQVHLSIPAVAERIRKLEENGVIEKYTLKINREKVNQNLLAFVFVSLDKVAQIQNFSDTIVSYDCVLECHHIAGSHDYLLKIAVADTSELENFITSKLKAINGISKSSTIICLTTLKEELNV